MKSRYSCQSCGHLMEIPEHMAGKSLRCSSCKTGFDAPSAADSVHEDVGVRTLSECSSCGAEMVNGAAFCGTCGVPAGSGPPVGGFIQRPVLITVLAVLQFVGSGFMILAGLISILVVSDEPIVGLLLVLFYLCLGILTLFCGIGLWKLKPWGRSIQIGLSIFGLIGIPVGTIISALILYYMFRPEVKILFSGREEFDLTVEERAILAQRQGSSAAATAAIVGGVVLVVIAILGIIAAIAIPNFTHALDRGRQKRTMADVRIIGTAVGAYAVDHMGYPAGINSVHELQPLLVPEYIRQLPLVDGWQHPIHFQTSENGAEFKIVSLGRDGFPGDQSGGATSNFNDDIIFSNGYFYQWPEGTDVR